MTSKCPNQPPRVASPGTALVACVLPAEAARALVAAVPSCNMYLGCEKADVRPAVVRSAHAAAHRFRFCSACARVLPPGYKVVDLEHAPAVRALCAALHELDLGALSARVRAHLDRGGAPA
jgi:hypothetical protein